MAFTINLEIGIMMDCYLVFDLSKFQVSITINAGVVNFKTYIPYNKYPHQNAFYLLT